MEPVGKLHDWNLVITRFIKIIGYCNPLSDVLIKYNFLFLVLIIIYLTTLPLFEQM
jgi:hypothetical protein